MKQSDVSKFIHTEGDKYSPEIKQEKEYKSFTITRIRLPHGWLVMLNDRGACFVPFAENGTGWGKNDPVQISIEEDDPKTTLKFDF